MTILTVATGAATPSYQKPQNPSTPSVVRTHQATTCEELHKLPQQLAFTPVKEKQPYLPEWQNRPLTRGQIEHQILANGATGYGLRTGTASGGIIAIDIDGPLADAKLTEISGGELPQTPAWTSGKPSCRQIAFQLSKPIQRVLESTGFTRHFIDCGEGQQLDFRYNGCQSVLPPSLHPETGRYEWIVSFSDCEIATAPDWLESLLVDWAIASQPKPKPIKRGERGHTRGFNLAGRMRWDGPGKSNEALGAIAAYVIEREGITDLIEAEARGWEIANEKGYQEYASRDEKRDRRHLRRWIECKLKRENFYPVARLSGSGDPRLNELRSEDSRYRFNLALAAAKAAGKIFSSFNQALKWINAWLEKNAFFTIGTGTWKKLRHLAAFLVGVKDHTQLINGKRSTVLYTARVSGTVSPPLIHPKLSLLTWQAIATATAPKPKSQPPKPEFKKGNRVIIDDRTGLPYCGKECTITAVLPDGTYRLDITYQGKRLRLRKRKNAVEALASFLSPVEPPQTPPETPESQVNEVWVRATDIERLGLKGKHYLLDAIGGAAAQRIRPGEVPQSIWKVLLSLECRESNVNRYAHIPSTLTDQSTRARDWRSRSVAER